MTGLIINHNTKYIVNLIQLFRGCDVINYTQFNAEKAETYDYIILSGGPIDIDGDNILEEKEWLRNTNKPVLGICLGLQILCLAFGETMLKFPKNRKLKESFVFDNFDYNMQYNHMYYFDKLPAGFIGEIKNNIITYMKHETKPILAFQGHPEVTDQGDKIKNYFLENFVR